MEYAAKRREQSARIEAMHRVEGRLLLDIEEQVGSCLTWPVRMTEALLSTHLHFPERWQLSLFLLGNRCPPVLMADWYLKRGMLKDKAACEQVADLIKKHKTGELERQGRTTWIMDATVTKPVWDRKHPWDGVGDPAENKNQVIETPHFASDWQHEHHWDTAVQLLKMPAPAVFTNKLTSCAARPVPLYARADKVELLNRWEAEKRSE